ncbi:pyruvate phosphate dikinase, putative [Bodo saltans]|uniref:Pyruvate, phosphate dikinase n=1 Tax=Bodo saltans TaxID=75058 RepID=A0A0S4IJT3_BODSA|nr:pyruvate phosphate dikinase, putative [Bodo saltans]|eukprot:CUE93981.1 pyruvate phosphate dikinase, putative [Bodo saltans]
MSKYVYFFGSPKAEGDRSMKQLLGGKGANLAEMVNLGIPVPPGFTITTEVCAIYTATKGKLPDEVTAQVKASLARVEKEMKRKFGDPSNPLLFSVRSGAAASMPGMMDTVLNLGLNTATVDAWVARRPSDESRHFIYDSYRRFITMYSDVVMQTGREEYEEAITHMKKSRGVKSDADLTSDDLKKLCDEYLVLYQKKTGGTFPQDPMQQLFAAVNAVFRSWSNHRAETYRRLNHITGLLGTAVNIQAMVFGNLNNTSATGVAFSRSPSDGENFFYGEFLINAQGEDVVAGIRTPQQIGKVLSLKWAKEHNVSEMERLKKFPSMEEAMPECYRQLCDIRGNLENHFRDMQDIEFTVESGRLWMLQCRNAKRTALASIKCAHDMVGEGLITKEEAILRLDPNQIDHLMHQQIDPKAAMKPIGKGLAASPGAAVGQVVFSATDAMEWHAAGKKVIMVRLETSPEDLAGMNAATGILTVRGGMTSHAAVVARGMGKCCVSGCGDIVLNGKSFTLHGHTFKEGEWISIDGTRGLIFKGKAPLVDPSFKGVFSTVLGWCKQYKRLGVRANADTPKDSENAVTFGAEGVGLCRTEHMFFGGARIDAMRQMILAENEAGRVKALKAVEPLQRSDFIEIFKSMGNRPVTIRLLDPPLHEFVPHEEKAQADLAAKMGVPVAFVAQRVRSLHEENPMLGHRGCRLGISYPEIYNMQVRAIIEAAIEVGKTGLVVNPEIMIPLVGKREELEFTKLQAIKTAEAVLAARPGVKVNYTIGTMIEVPRAAITADEIAKEADFFSFGTNDLTQMGCGFSRDDSAVFLARYAALGIYPRDPFQSLDQEGVGELIRIAIRKGRSVKPLLKIGICGEHGGDPRTILFCHKVGMNYVSCSPFRVPTAIVAAAQAALLEVEEATAARKKLAAGSKL